MQTVWRCRAMERSLWQATHSSTEATMILRSSATTQMGHSIRASTKPGRQPPTSVPTTSLAVWPCTVMEESLSPVTPRDESKKQCALACFKANGSLDTSFNGTGKVVTTFGGDGDAEGQGVAAQSDGKTVVVGYATVGGVQRFAVERYKTDGALDTSFGGTGRVLTAVGISGSNATGVALQKDGKIVVAGYAVNNSGRIYDFACLRYNADGSLDQSFGDHGKVTTDVGRRWQGQLPSSAKITRS